MHFETSIGQHLIKTPDAIAAYFAGDSGKVDKESSNIDLPDFCHTTDVLQLMKLTDTLLDSYKELSY